MNTNRESTNPRESLVLRAQSSMEYFVTYGWSIVFLSMVLAALYAAGVFNLTGLVGTNSCSGSTGFICTQSVLYSNGLLQANIGVAGTSMALTGDACTANNVAPGSGSFLSLSPAPALLAGQQALVSFICPLTYNSLGSSFSGYLWVTYNSLTSQGQTVQSGLVAGIAHIGTSVTAIATSSSSQPLVNTYWTYSSPSCPIGTLVFTANAAGGTAPYTYNVVIYSSGGTLLSNSLSSATSSTSNVVSYNNPSGWITANVYITDSATGSVSNVLSTYQKFHTNC